MSGIIIGVEWIDVTLHAISNVGPQVGCLAAFIKNVLEEIKIRKLSVDRQIYSIFVLENHQSNVVGVWKASEVIVERMGNNFACFNPISFEPNIKVWGLVVAFHSVLVESNVSYVVETIASLDTMSCREHNGGTDHGASAAVVSFSILSKEEGSDVGMIVAIGFSEGGSGNIVGKKKGK